MKVYVAGSLRDVVAVRQTQEAVVQAGHDVVHDWTRGLDVLIEDYADEPHAAGTIASNDLRAVLGADALVLVANEEPGRGMFVELGAALARVELGAEMQVVVVGSRTATSVFYFHRAVQRYDTIAGWLDAD